MNKIWSVVALGLSLGLSSPALSEDNKPSDQNLSASSVTSFDNNAVWSVLALSNNIRRLCAIEWKTSDQCQEDILQSVEGLRESINNQCDEIVKTKSYPALQQCVNNKITEEMLNRWKEVIKKIENSPKKRHPGGHGIMNG